ACGQGPQLARQAGQSGNLTEKNQVPKRIAERTGGKIAYIGRNKGGMWKKGGRSVTIRWRSKQKPVSKPWQTKWLR
ncbi:MAG: hypothetical protein K2O97_06040, partial [Acetatifactor sp.]|nr:hypothetical protein [Acetatifactor sp.]